MSTPDDNGAPAAAATLKKPPPVASAPPPATENDYITMAESPPPKEPTPLLQEGEEDSKPAATTLKNPTFEDDGTFALPPGKTFKTTTPTKTSPSISPSASTDTNNDNAGNNNNSINNNNHGKGAQILMSRFSNWRQKANENATVLWKQAKEAQEKAAASNQGPLATLRQVSGIPVGVGVGVGGSNASTISDDMDDDKETKEDDNDINSSREEDEDDEEEDGEEEDGEEGHHDARRAIPNMNLPTRKELRTRAQAVATGVVGSLDTYATGFRGRYAVNSNDSPRPGATPSSPQTAARESQTSLILKSRAASHLQEILDSLEPYQYVLLLGAGRLSVNLKNPYDVKQGTYVDFLVDGGAADKSGVVAVGDAVVKVGSQDVRKHTIEHVPSIIAKAKRPVVLVLTTGVEMDVERITYLDLAVAMMHRIRSQDEKQKQEMIASAHKNKPQPFEEEEEETKDGKEEEEKAEAKGDDDSPTDGEPKDDGEEATDEDNPTQPTEGTPKEETPEIGRAQIFDDIEIPAMRTVEGYTSPPQPPMAARMAYKHLVGKRCNDNFSVTQFSQFAASDDNFREVLRNAFLCCAVDGRRFPFLGRHLTMEQDMLDNNSYKESTSQQLQQPNKNSPNALLMLFLELLNFADLHGVTPVCRRKDVAQRIAYKFFLPTKVNDMGSGQSRLEPPMFDFHHIVTDSVLRKLESDLSNAESDGISQDLFLDFQHAVVDALCGTTFLLFLVSNHCARMRGYLRNVAPYINVPLKSVMETLTMAPSENAMVHSGAKNYFLFVLIYLMQLEKDPTSTLSTDDLTVLGRNGRRMVGAAGGLCCYLYIGRVVVPAIESYQKIQNNTDSSSTPAEGEQGADAATFVGEGGDIEAIMKAMGQLWEIFVVPGVGALEHTWKSKETKEYLLSLRSKLRSIRKDVLNNSVEGSDQQSTRFAQKFGSDPGLLKNIKDLADHLLYDYAIHSHSQFREHPFHEMMCNEAIKAKKEQTKLQALEEQKEENDVPANSLPDLPSGCIKRLLRKVDLPVGVSTHKPINPSSNQKIPATEEKPSTPLNADFAVVFGTSVGSDLAVKMMSPAMDRQSDIRRYTCQDVTLDGEELPESFEDEVIPPTLESYAVLPPTRLSAFAEVTGNVSISADGWECSLLNFQIPRADDGSQGEESQSLYGVSLVFQQSSNARYYPRQVSQTQLVRTAEVAEGEKEAETGDESKDVERATIDDEGKFSSPISFSTPVDDHWSSFNRSIQVSKDVPKFNSHLREKRWVDRVLQDETRDQNVPATVGVALVSRQNVVIAMRKTLWSLLRDFSRTPDDQAGADGRSKDVITCGSLVDLLGNFAHQDVEGRTALRSILEPYMRAASAPWIERPLSAQKEEFERHAGQQLITCLPPIPLALLFIAALLEQKIILTSSRRSILFSATAALTGMLKPLKWCHLLVPLVPSALAKDLIQYPAPFILGMPSEDPSTLEVMNDLPCDVTLVDLDVGRVILAPEFSFDSTGFSDYDEEDAGSTMSVLRSQVLYLAQILGSHFGAKLFRDAWSCDSPALTLVKSFKEEADYDVLRSVCRSFVDELLAGTSSSCFWVEEEPPADNKKGGSSEPTILFDEDRFFHIKRWREENGYEPLLKPSDLHVNRSLALSMDGFHLVLETFVRCQSMNWYLSSQSKDGMALSL